MAAIFLLVTIAIQAAPWDVTRDVPGWQGSALELRLWVGAVQLVAVGLHILMYWVARSTRFSLSFTLRAGLVYQAGLCLLITVGDQWLSFNRDGRYQDLTLAALIIVTYPLFVPQPPRRTLVSALAASAMLPLGLWLLGATGQPQSFEDYFVATLMGAMCTAIAVTGAVVIHGLYQAVAEARQLGSYELETLIGRGGMGEVWRAKHRLLARPAAVKVIRPEVLGARGADEGRGLIERFEREAQATATMSSPHTIGVYDFGVAQDGTFFYVMELLEGLDLATLVRQYGPVPAARAAYLLAQMCDSLGEAHEAGLIHRDVKPANVYVCRYGRRDDFVKVLDFGLVRPRGQTDDVGRAGARAVGGTPAFMAPEHITGQGPIDGRADIYGLGCVAYWLLTGHLVFEGASATDVMMQHVEAAAPPPSARSEMPVPAAMDAIVLSCLEKNPSRRPQTADELAARLRREHLLDGWTPDQAAHWWRLHRPVPAA